MSVNVSARQLADPGFTRSVEEALARVRRAAEHLRLEVTESAMTQDPEGARRTLTDLRDAARRDAPTSTTSARARRRCASCTGSPATR